MRSAVCQLVGGCQLALTLRLKSSRALIVFGVQPNVLEHHTFKVIR